MTPHNIIQPLWEVAMNPITRPDVSFLFVVILGWPKKTQGVIPFPLEGKWPPRHMGKASHNTPSGGLQSWTAQILSVTLIHSHLLQK